MMLSPYVRPIFILALYATIGHTAEIVFIEKDWAWAKYDQGTKTDAIASTSNIDGTSMNYTCASNHSSCVLVVHLDGNCEANGNANPIPAFFLVSGRRFTHNLFCVGPSLNGTVANGRVALSTHSGENITPLLTAFAAARETSVKIQYSNGAWTEVGFSLMGFTAVMTNMLRSLSTLPASSSLRGQRDL